MQGLSGGAATFIGSLTGSFVGLLALMLAALFNFRLNRRRDDQIRAEEARSVAAALYGEILLLRRELASVGNLTASAYMAEGTDESRTLKFDAHFLERCQLSEPTLYKALASKIGLLSADLVIAITEFHARFEEVRKWMPQLVDEKDRGFGYSVLYVLIPARDAIEQISPALRNIEDIADIATPANDPDFRKMKTMIEYEEERWAQK